MEILQRLISEAAFLLGEKFESAKRSEWTSTARAVLERSFPAGSSIRSSFETAQSVAFGVDDTEEQLRMGANGTLSSELAVLRSAVEQLSWGIEEENPMPTTKTSTKSTLEIFVSHSSKDLALAEAVVELVRSALGLTANQIRCSSVDGYKLPAGVNTESQLREEVNASTAVIGLITTNSLNSYYVMFELGARWGSGRFLAPLLAGVKPGALSGPLSLLNALSAENESDVHHLLAAVGEQLHIPLQNAASYLKHVAKVKELARGIPIQPYGEVKSAISEENVALKIELASVNEQLEKRPKLKPFGDVHYYVVEGENIPYCPTCFGTKNQLIPLPAGESFSGGFRRQCPACHTFYYEKPKSNERHQMGGGGRGGGSQSWMG